jgi:hypothetical protein
VNSLVSVHYFHKAAFKKKLKASFNSITMATVIISHEAKTANDHTMGMVITTYTLINIVK